MSPLMTTAEFNTVKTEHQGRNGPKSRRFQSVIMLKHEHMNLFSVCVDVGSRHLLWKLLGGLVQRVTRVHEPLLQRLLRSLYMLLCVYGLGRGRVWKVDRQVSRWRRRRRRRRGVVGTVQAFYRRVKRDPEGRK